MIGGGVVGDFGGRVFLEGRFEAFSGFWRFGVLSAVCSVIIIFRIIISRENVNYTSFDVMPLICGQALHDFY